MHKSLSLFEQVSRHVLSSIFLACCCTFLSPSQSQAATGNEDEESIELGSTKVIRYKIDNDLKVRGWKLSPEIYFGNAKVNGKWGLGLLVDKGDYAYGLNNTQASVTWRF